MAIDQILIESIARRGIALRWFHNWDAQTEAYNAQRAALGLACATTILALED